MDGADNMRQDMAPIAAWLFAAANSCEDEPKLS
jgi:hypothetical protein